MNGFNPMMLGILGNQNLTGKEFLILIGAIRGSIINLDECIKNNPIIFLLNKISLGYLYYQFLTAIRKDTRK